MKRLTQLGIGLLLMALFIIGLPAMLPAGAQQENQSDTFFLGTVTEVTDQTQIPTDDNAALFTQRVKVRRQDNGQELSVALGSEFQPMTDTQLLKSGNTVILTSQTTIDGQEEVVIVEPYRLTLLFYLGLGFVVLVLVVAKWRGFLAMVGMMLSLGVLVYFIVPQILQGSDPVLISLVGSAVIGTLTMYLAHGWDKKSHIAVASILVTLLAVTALSFMAVRAAQLAGLGSEDAYYLQFGETANINLQGLLLGGIILGALGVLDDIIVSQVSVVEQLKALHTKITFEELYKRAMEVGKDHVASLVNTLVLAYAGANFPLFILFYINPNIPLWVTLNNQIVAEEIVRTLVGSIGLVLAVPLTTLLAAALITQPTGKPKKNLHLGHAH